MKFGDLRNILKETDNTDDREIVKEMLRRQRGVNQEIKTNMNLFYISAMECLLGGLSTIGLIGSVSQYAGSLFGVEVDSGTAYAFDATVALSGLLNMSYRIGKLIEPIENRITEELM